MTLNVLSRNASPGVELPPQADSVGASPVNVCFTSRSSAGAWQIRGVQIASMRSNWTALNKPSDEDLEKADVVCLVKRPDPRVIERARRMGKALVFDIVNSWAQPEDGMKYTDTVKAREFFSKVWKGIDADGYIFPTRRMQESLGGLVRDKITIYHHFRPRIEKNAIRERVTVIGYEGGDYLGEWRPRIEQACARRGIEFVANPQRLADLDIVILARGGEHGSFLARQFKSNVKLANAIGSGTPALVHYEEMSAHDTDTGDVLFFTNQPGSFERQLDRLIDSHALRLRIHERFLEVAPRFHITSIANQFEGFFQNVLEKRRSRVASGH